MKLLSLKINSLNDVFVQELRDIYDAEGQLVHALPKMAEAASTSELRMGFEQHLSQTQGHVSRLDRIFASLGQESGGETCEAMEGLISEGKDYINAEGDPMARDAGLIAVAQKVEHYEIAAYGTLRSIAKRLGNASAEALLQQTLEEESQTDKKLTSIAERQVNVGADKGPR
ncbi:MAG: ferritin-like domain-containing protein [Verrucomicrobia bacterium]|nr:ferritin-like domain-containing protein [Verrucomicrobiota bacterium]